MRIRISYKKGLPIRYTSTLDLQRIWGQTMRRAFLHVEYSKGFHPQPHIQLGNPLPLGFTSRDEKVDIWLINSLSIENIREKLIGKLPNGLEIISIEEIPLSEKPLLSQIQYCDYRVYKLDSDISIENLRIKIKELLDKKKIIRTKRNGKKYDLRPLIYYLNLEIDNNDKPFISMQLASQSNKTGRADEVMYSLGFLITDFMVERIGSFP